MREGATGRHGATALRLGAPSVAEVMAARGATSGFDYLRLFLSVAVVGIHAVRVTRGPDALASAPEWAWVFINAILVMFFALSGFLVAGSLARIRRLVPFLAARALRIFPALTVEVFLSALILGPLLTTLSLGAYASDPLFWRYLANALGIISFELPGVFDGNPAPEVNGSLWTVPYELECYVLLALLAAATVVRRPAVLLGGVALYGAYLGLSTVVDVDLAPTFQATMRAPEEVGVALSYILVPSFVAGVTIHALREHLPLNAALGAAAGLLALLMLGSPLLYGLAVLPAAYATAALGLANPPRDRVVASGDYSYGIYLYAYPVQQAVWLLAPGGQTILGNLAISLVIVSLFAAFSWHAIEKPTLRLKRHFGQAPKRGAGA